MRLGETEEWSFIAVNVGNTGLLNLYMRKTLREKSTRNILWGVKAAGA